MEPTPNIFEKMTKIVLKNHLAKSFCIAHKRLKAVTTRCVLRAVNASKCVCGRSRVPDLAGGAYSTDGMERAIRKGKGHEGEGKGEESGGKRWELRGGKPPKY